MTTHDKYVIFEQRTRILRDLDGEKPTNLESEGDFMAKQGKNEQQKQEAEFLRIYQETGVQKIAYEAVGWDKTKASKFVKKWRQEQEAQQSENNPATTDEPKQEIKESRTSQEKVVEMPIKEESVKVVEAPQMPQIASEMHEPIKSTPTEEKAEETPNAKQTKQVFSFRAAVNDIAVWRAYATATGMSLEKVANAALKEYVENHPLTGTEQVIFEALKARNSK